MKDDAHAGKVKVPTLRNVTKRPYPEFVKAYLHSGTFKSLKDVIHFYNKRVQEPDLFPPPDVAGTVNEKELGNLGLTDMEEDDLIAFLETLSDGFVLSPTSQPSRPTATRDTNQYVREAIRVERFREKLIQAASKNQETRR